MAVYQVVLLVAGLLVIFSAGYVLGFYVSNKAMFQITGSKAKAGEDENSKPRKKVSWDAGNLMDPITVREQQDEIEKKNRFIK